MLKRIIFGLIVVGALVGCSEEKVEEPKAEKVAAIEPAQKKETEKPSVKPAEKPVEEQVEQQPAKTEITFAEFEKKFQRDPEEKQYINGVFIFKDGTRENADYINYIGGDLFEYASAIFQDGKLAKIQMETEGSVDDIEKGLGITFDDSVVVDPYTFGYEIIFDDKFSDNNIERFPSELD